MHTDVSPMFFPHLSKRQEDDVQARRNELLLPVLRELFSLTTGGKLNKGYLRWVERVE